MTGMSSSEPASAARTALITAAEQLFASKGVDGVSLREIMRQAGQRNSTALQYHFGDRDGLVRALMDKHSIAVSIRREALLDRLEAAMAPSLREVADAFVAPLVAKLADPDGGREFLRVAAQLVNGSDRRIDADQPVAELVYDQAGTLQRWSKLAGPLMPAGTTGSSLHRRFSAIRFGYTELGHRAQLPVDSHNELFASQLTDLVTAIMAADPSPETLRLMRKRRR
jgi:AcrR family transcriptional regulator